MAVAMICTQCGTEGPTRQHTPGSFAVELLLFLFFIIPGVVYGIWRLAARKQVCRICGSPNVVPVETPMGRKLRENLGRPKAT